MKAVGRQARLEHRGGSTPDLLRPMYPLCHRGMVLSSPSGRATPLPVPPRRPVTERCSIMADNETPSNAPEHCPGTASEAAGKAAACAGCPNQATCASAPKGPDPDIPLIQVLLWR